MLEEEDSAVVGVEVVDVVADEVGLEIEGDSVVAVEVVEGDVVHPVAVDVDVVECLHSKEGRLHSKPRLSGTLISLIRVGLLWALLACGSGGFISFLNGLYESHLLSLLLRFIVALTEGFTCWLC